MDALCNDVSASLRMKLDEARAAYGRAHTNYKHLMDIARDTSGPRDPAFSDGNLAIRQATQSHRLARLNFERALKDFTDFVLYGKLPPTPEP